MTNHLIIMAGGVGSRFWPMSTPEKPKQFIDVLGVGRSLLQLTVDRFGDLFTPDRIWIVTSAAYRSVVMEQLPGVPEENILLEPCMRNTAPCIGYVAWKIKQRHPDASLVVSPADHFILDAHAFRAVIQTGLDFVKGTGRVLTLGMSPTRPDTGYGYIHSGVPVAGSPVLAVQAFKEKPVLEVAQRYLAEGGYYWNAGIFLWEVATVEKAIRRFEPEMAAILDEMGRDFYTPQEQERVNCLFPTCKSISIDYAVMERLSGQDGLGSDGLYVLPGDFGWSDLGTWGSLYARLEKDDEGNAVVGDGVTMIESRGCVVRAPHGKKMVLQGMDDYIVAEDQGTLLICKKDQEQRIKEFSSR